MKTRQTVHHANTLGWVSLGVGLSELAAPSLIQRTLGLKDCSTNRGILRILGIREVMHGVGLLDRSRGDRHVVPALWSRVAGDVLDTALLAIAATKSKNLSGFATIATIVTAIGIADACASTIASRK